MAVSELIRRGTLVPELSSRTKGSALNELLAALVGAGRVPRDGLQAIADAVMARELLGTTGIGRGMAFPCARHDLVPHTLVALGRSNQGIECESLDEAPVHIVLMVLSNRRSSLDYLRALAQVVRLFRDERLIRATRAAKTRDEILRGIEAAERPLV
ncbi:MAG TPA: PTS sugar transporter subunit IIA [Phycisphaerae bacterium]|nr:PTS sugar transporter subunit IIA [Phycisphaerae bacterium]